MYRINEIFYSLQGEGHWTGTPMVFVRFSGCNLRCPFCDTDFKKYVEMSLDEVLIAVRSLAGECRRVVFTGGEPSLQLDQALVDALQKEDFFIHVETNGTHPLPKGLDWVTLSPKTDIVGMVGNPEVVIEVADELKLVYHGGADPEKWRYFPAVYYYLQPCSGENTEEVVKYVLEHPLWGLSLQTHKLLNIR